MSAERKCRACGIDVPANAPFGHCPKCLLELGFGPMPEVLATPAGLRVFGDYELLGEIGRGGMGVIYKARQMTLNRLVALKMVKPGEAASPIMIDRFRTEAEAAANLHHPNIVPIYETGEHQGQPFFSMALIEGSGLDRYVTNDGFGFRPAESRRDRGEQIARLIAKVARAVDYAHKHAVLHRDLKPSNIIVDAHGEPHLTDFGVAKVIDHAGSSLTASGAIMGTPSYMAPEQAAGGSKRVSTGADIYSLGAILYEMLIGHPPFRADTPIETLKQVVETEPTNPTTIKDGVDRDLATICMKCLEKEPPRRYPSAAALAEDLERWLRHEPITARPVHSGERLWRWCRRNPTVATLMSAVALLLIGLTVGSIAVALRFKALNEGVASQHKHLRKEILSRLVEVYADPDGEFYDISSETRRALAGQITPRPLMGQLLELTNVLYIYEHPTNMLEAVSPILSFLEDKLSQRLQRTVAIHLRMATNYGVGHKTLESEGLTFGRAGPASYVYLEKRGRGVRLLAMQDQELTLALFTHRNSQIASLHASKPDLPLSSLLTGRSLAFSHTNSTTGYWVAKRFMATNGIRATNLARYAFFGSQRGVIDAVGTGKADFGAGNLKLVEEYPDLRIIAKLDVPDLGLCWIAGKGLNATIEKHLRECLLELRDPDILGKLESDVSGFKIPSAEALKRLQIIIDGAAEFDAGSR